MSYGKLDIIRLMDLKYYGKSLLIVAMKWSFFSFGLPIIFAPSESFY